MFPALAGGFFTASTTWEVYYNCHENKFFSSVTFLKANVLVICLPPSIMPGRFHGGSVVKNLPVSAGERCGFNPCLRKIPCRRKWQATPVFLSEGSHGQGSLAACSPRGRKESDTTEAAWQVDDSSNSGCSLMAFFLCLTPF